MTSDHSKSGQKAVFLDRDGVLNIPEFRDGRSFAPKQLEDFTLYADVKEACALLCAQGYHLVVVTNQPDIGHGMQTPEGVDAMHAVLRSTLPLLDIKVCPHTRQDQCDCRKPAPGMLMEAAHAHGLALDQSAMIGDRHSDIEAGQRAGCKDLIFIDHGYDEPQPPPHIPRAANLLAAARILISA